MRALPLKSLRFATLLGLMFGALSLGEARAANPLELNFWLNGPRYDGAVVDCERALPTIATQFWEKESSFWNSSLKITTPIEIAGDGKVRKVHFSIIEDGGFSGYGNGVEWCVVGLDRNWAYNPSCRAARP